MIKFMQHLLQTAFPQTKGTSVTGMDEMPLKDRNNPKIFQNFL